MFKILLTTWLTLLLAGGLWAEDLAPKPLPGRFSRVLLYVQGSSRALDYQDVLKIDCIANEAIRFQTNDGFVVIHHGPFTLIGPKSEFAESDGRPRFFDPK